MSKQIKKICIIIILIVVTVINVGILYTNISLSNSNNEPDSKTLAKGSPTNEIFKTESSDVKEDDSSQVTRDVEYKMFYGEWEITKIIAKPINFPLDLKKAESAIGTRISYTFESIKLNGVEVVKNPVYFINLVPVMPDKVYIGGFPSLEDLGITGNYFAYVYIRNAHNYFDDFSGLEFYIKDDSTLIAYDNEVNYELKRVSYIEGAEYQQVHP